MKICQVNPGCGIEVPPKGWGAVEKIVWEFITNFKQLGHEVDLRWESEVTPGEYDLVQVHMANLALNLAEKGIPYIFQFHDHQAFLYGKDSFVYKQNLEAIEKSTLSIVPARYLVDYFDSNKVLYFSHGVDTNFYSPTNKQDSHSLLMVANNGLRRDPGYDRKGFTEGIKAAVKANIPITIVGPENNKNYIKSNRWVEDVDINWIFEPTQEELVSIYREHTIFLNPSELEAGHPNLTILEAMACGLPVIGCMENDLEGMVRVNKDSNEVLEGIKKVISNYDDYRIKALQTAENLSWMERSKSLVKLVQPESMKDILIREYTVTPKNTKSKHKTVSNIPEVKVDFNGNGPKCSITGNSKNRYKVQFKNGTKIIWEDIISSGMWTQASKGFFIPWNITVTDIHKNKEIFNYDFNCKGKLVRVNFESSSLGDTIAWLPYVEKFRKTHKCKVVCSTYKNFLFEKSYPDIKFVNPGEIIEDVYATYRLGWFYENDMYNDNLHPRPFVNQPLQKTAADILGVTYTELLPNLDLEDYVDYTLPDRYFTFSIQSTAQCKYWNNKDGWKFLLDKLQAQGYHGVCIDQNKNFGTQDSMNVIPENSIDKTGLELYKTAGIIKNGKFHIGLSSGLSWLTWALDHPTVLISGFTSPEFEFKNKCLRIHNENVCNSCFNSADLKFDPSDWNWCPRLKNTDRQFECTKTITPEQVFKEIKDKLL